MKGANSLLPAAVQAHYGHTPTIVLADTGYRNEWDLQKLETQGLDGYIALGREGPAAPRNPRVPALCGPHAAQSRPSACLRPHSPACTFSVKRVS